QCFRFSSSSLSSVKTASGTPLSRFGRSFPSLSSAAFSSAVGGSSNQKSAISNQRDLLSEIERAFFQRVNVADHQDADEAEHAPEDHAAVRDRFFVNDRPRIHEHDLEIEQDEEHGDEIELHAKARLSLALRNHPAFVGSVFRRRASPGFSEQHADEKRRRGESDCDNDLQENRQIFLNHSRPRRLRLNRIILRQPGVADLEYARSEAQSPWPATKAGLCISCHSFSPRRVPPGSGVFHKHATGAFPRLRSLRFAREDSRAQYQRVL